MNRSHHLHRHFALHYPIPLSEKVYSFFLAPIITLVILFIIFRILGKPTASFVGVSPTYLGTAIFYTFIRLSIAYLLAVIVSVPLALLADKSVWAERTLLPLFDIVQSIPILAFFPLIVTFFIHFRLFNAAAVFIIFLSMLWNMVFSIVGGLRVVPTDIKSAAYVFRIRGASYLTRVLLPSIVPYLVTGSLLAWAQGWNIIIIAEVLHTYIPGSTRAQDLFGIGSVLVNAVSLGHQNIFIAATVSLILTIACLNFFIWQRLLHYAEKYRFE